MYVSKNIALHVEPAIYCGTVHLHVMKCVRGNHMYFGKMSWVMQV